MACDCDSSVVTYLGNFDGEVCEEIETVGLCYSWTEAVAELVELQGDEVLDVISVEEDVWDDDDEEPTSYTLWQASWQVYA